MKTPELTQRHINDTCDEILRQGETITIARVRKVIGYGNYSTIAPMVLRYKEDPAAARQLAEKASTAAPAATPEENGDTARTSLTLQLENTLARFHCDDREACALALREAIDTYIHARLEQTDRKARTLRQQYQLTCENLGSHIDYLSQQNEQLREHIGELRHQLQQQQTDTRRQAARQAASAEASADRAASREPSIASQLKALQGRRCAALSQADGCIYLKVDDFSPTLLKELKKGKTGRHVARTRYNYKKGLWELYDFSMVTVQFLFSNGFDISEHLVQYVAKLKQADSG